MPKVRDTYDPDDDDREPFGGEGAAYLICPVWPSCHHPELCKEECRDNDLKKELLDKDD